MPFLTLRTNVALDAQKSTYLIKTLSATVAQLTGKPECYVMLEISWGHCMLFGGSDAPLMYGECKSIGLTPQQAKKLSSVISQLVNQELDISSDRVYLEFSNCLAEFWGWNGSTFG